MAATFENIYTLLKPLFEKKVCIMFLLDILSKSVLKSSAFKELCEIELKNRNFEQASVKILCKWN